MKADGGEAARSYLNNRGINTAAIDKFKLGFDGKRLVIPYLTPAGPWHLKYRSLGGDGPKYTYDEGAGQHLYNTQTLLTAERVVVVEGELDAIAVEMAGLPAVAYPGAQTWKNNQQWVWCFDSCSDITIVADGDEVGREAARTVAGSLRKALPDTDVRVVDMPDGEDSNSFIVANSELDFLDLIGAI